MSTAKDLDEVSGEAIEKRVVRHLLPYLKGRYVQFSAGIALVLVVVAVTLYTPMLLARIIDDALVPKNKELLYSLCWLFVAISIMRVISFLGFSYILQVVGQKIMHNIRNDLMSKLLRMPVPFFDRNKVGRLVTRVSNDVVNLGELFGPGFVTLISDLLIIGGTIIAMLMLNFKLGIYSISIFPIMLIVMNYFSKRLRLVFRDTRESLSRLNGFFAERMTGMSLIQLLGMEKFENKRFEEYSEDYCSTRVRTINTFALFHPAITILSSVTVAIVLYIGGHFVLEESIPIGVLAAFFAYVQTLFMPIRSLTEKYNIFQNAMSSAERIFSVIHLTEESGLREDPTNQEISAYKKFKFNSELEFRDISFSYEDIEKTENPIWALKETSFKIKAGEKIAVIGHTGAGKTTLLSLLFRFYEPQFGEILLDGVNVREFAKQKLRTQFGFVQQDVFIFSGSIRENLCLLREGITENELLAACLATGMDRLIQKMPQGIDTILDERGSNLSLGERQVLAFTRVLLQQPQIIICDEATSHMDTESEEMIQQAMDALIEDKTSIIIAHRLSTIKNVDRIFVFEKGRIIESGSHSQLVAQAGAYSRFLAIQNFASI